MVRSTAKPWSEQNLEPILPNLNPVKGFLMSSSEDDMVSRPHPSALLFDLAAKCSVSTLNVAEKLKADPFLKTSKARAATLHLPHGPVQLPLFMPVATQASLKGLTPKQLEDTSCRLCLNNTYHLLVFTSHQISSRFDNM